jgi:hypothetical protein
MRAAHPETVRGLNNKKGGMNMQVKVFDTYSSGVIMRIKRNIIDALEDQVNVWLKDNPDIKVVEIKQSAAGGSWGPIQLFISIWYETVP